MTSYIMAKRLKSLKAQKIEKPKHTCRECANSYDWHDKAFNGGMILCRCPYDERSKHGKFSKFLSDPQCDKFLKRD